MQLSNPSAASASPVPFWRKSLNFHSKSNPSPDPAIAPQDSQSPDGSILESSGYMDKGSVRSDNEDFFRIEPDLGFYVVADGMGGAEAGEYASHLAVNTVVEHVVSSEKRDKQLLLSAMEEANRRVVEAAKANPKLKGMGTTLIAGLAVGEEIHITSVGDSRAYLMDDAGLHPITQDQSWRQEVGRFLGLDEESLQKHPMRNVLTMAVGHGAPLKVNNYAVHLEPSSILLMCTDGLHGVVEQSRIEEILRDTGDNQLETKCRSLVEAALAAGGPDNISVVLVRSKSNAGKKRRGSSALTIGRWEHVIDSWRRAPAYHQVVAAMALLAVTASLMASTLFYAPRIGKTAPSGSTLMSAIAARATVDLADDFRSGLGAWTGKPGWQKSWSAGPSGWIQPGRLALYRDTIPLTDYRLEFMGQIQSKALGFAFRAADTNNYYAAKIVIVKPGPLPTIAFLHYKVINGHEGPRKQSPVLLAVQSDTLYRVLVEARGDHFTVTLNGQLADAWSDGQLKSGGIGLFADKGEVSWVRAVQIVDKDDFLGRLALTLRRSFGGKE